VQDADLERTSAYVGFLFPCYSTPLIVMLTIEAPYVVGTLPALHLAVDPGEGHAICPHRAPEWS
jgi:hypothetical protein